MFCTLFRALCCLCGNTTRPSIPHRNRDYRHCDIGDWYDRDDSDDEGFPTAKARAGVFELSKLKRYAIEVTTDVIVAENLMRQHGDDSSLLMYHDRCANEMYQALDKLPSTSHGARVKRPYHYKSRRNARHTSGIV